MIRSLMDRWRRELQLVPPHMQWLRDCHPSVLQAYLDWRRVLIRRQVPIAVVCMLILSMLKQTQWFPEGSPVFLTMYVLCFLAGVWPPALVMFAGAAWRGAPMSPSLSRRLQALAIGFYAMAALSIVAVVAVLAVYLFVWLR